MLTVYCEKMNQTGLSASAFGLIGILIGAIIGLFTAYFTQRWQHKNALDLERNRNQIKLFTDFALSDLLKFIDEEIDYIQRLYAKEMGVEMEGVDYSGLHRHQLAKYKSLISMFNDAKLEKQFDDLLEVRAEFLLQENKNVREKLSYDPTEIVENAAKAAGKIKIALFHHCSIK